MYIQPNVKQRINDGFYREIMISIRWNQDIYRVKKLIEDWEKCLKAIKE